MELLSLNTEYEAQEEIIAGILTEMSNHNR
uniref:Uncharacterized protein n=1 Tax=Romanomermis culicivorax TaxID=13658 RepID=A0A915I9M2_ROMCU